MPSIITKDYPKYNMIKRLLALPDQDFATALDMNALIDVGEIGDIKDFTDFKTGIEKIRAEIDDEELEDFLDSHPELESSAQAIFDGFKFPVFEYNVLKERVESVENEPSLLDEVELDEVDNPIEKLKADEDNYALIKKLVGLSNDDLDIALAESGLATPETDEVDELQDFKAEIKKIQASIGDQELDVFLTSKIGDTNTENSVRLITESFESNFFKPDVINGRVTELGTQDVVDLEPSSPPKSPKQIRQERLDKFKNSRYIHGSLKKQIEKMEVLASGDVSGKQQAAEAYLDRALELADNMEAYETMINERYEANIQSWQDTPMTSKEQFIKNKENNMQHREITERFLESQTLTCEALMQGSHKIMDSSEDECASLDMDEVIAPEIAKNPTLSQERNNDMLQKRIFKKDDPDQMLSLDQMLANRKKSKYKKKDPMNEELLAHGAQLQQAVLDQNTKYTENNKDCFTTPMRRSAYQEIFNYKQMQIDAWKAKNKPEEGKDQVEPTEDQYSKMRISDMETIDLAQIEFKNLGNGVYTPNANRQITLPDGSKRLPRQEDMVKGMVQLLMLMQAEGKTKFKCKSDSHQAREAFRVALEVCSIPPEQAEVIKVSQKERGREYRVSSKVSTRTKAAHYVGKLSILPSSLQGGNFVPLVTTPKERKMINGATKNHDMVSHEAKKAQYRIREKQQQEQLSQLESQRDLDQEQDSSPNRPGIGH